MTRARTITGAGVVCRINGTILGRVRGLDFGAAAPRKPVYGIDSLTPQELLTTTVKISGRIRLYRTVADGGAEGAGVVAGLPDLTRERYFSIQLIERGSDTVIFEAWHCSCTNQTWSVPDRGIIEGTVDFEALDFRNELHSIS